MSFNGKFSFVKNSTSSKKWWLTKWKRTLMLLIPKTKMKWRTVKQLVSRSKPQVRSRMRTGKWSNAQRIQSKGLKLMRFYSGKHWQMDKKWIPTLARNACGQSMKMLPKMLKSRLKTMSTKDLMLSLKLLILVKSSRPVRSLWQDQALTWAYKDE